MRKILRPKYQILSLVKIIGWPMPLKVVGVVWVKGLKGFKYMLDGSRFNRRGDWIDEDDVYGIVNADYCNGWLGGEGRKWTCKDIQC